FSSRRRHTRFSRDWSSDVCSSDLGTARAHSTVERCGARHRVADSAGHHADRVRQRRGGIAASERPVLRMKAFITGARGQLGLALQRLAPPGIEVVPFGRADLDISDRDAVEATLRAGADALINAAAYTDVEGAERNAADAFRINSEGPALLANACAAHRIRLVHVSTDFVFDGQKQTPYQPSDEP